MKQFLCELTDMLKVETALARLEPFGISQTYVIEEPSPKKILIGGLAKILPENVKGIKLLPIPSSIDWENQAMAHSPYYKDGFIQVDLSELTSKKAPSFNLYPGPGFGDISHETTQLMLENLAPLVNNKPIIDIGSGNGVLSLASYFLNAKSVIGLEINQDALLHAKKNKTLNNVDSSKIRFFKKLPENFVVEKNTVVLMNMTYFEQLKVFETLPFIFQTCSIFAFSGILIEQRDSYKKSLSTLGLEVVEEKKLGNWMFCIAQKK